MPGKTTPLTSHARARRAAIVMVMLVLASACSDSTEPVTTASGAAPTTAVAPTAPATSVGTVPGVEPGFGVEPGTGTEVVLTPPATAPTGRSLAIPLSVSAGAGDTPWDEARLEVVVDGPVVANYNLDLAALAPGGSVRGTLLVNVEPGTGDALSRGIVTVDLLLYQSEELANARRSQVALVADGETVYLGLGSVGDLERARLDALLAVGRITQAEYDAAYAATLEKTTG